MPEETTAERIAREAKEKAAEQKDKAERSGPLTMAASGTTAEREAATQKNAPDSVERDGSIKGRMERKAIDDENAARHNQASADQVNGLGKPKGRILGDEENPSDALKADGSKSPHDVTSDGGSRQEAAHKQVKELQAATTGKANGQESVTDKGTQPASDRPLSPSPISADDRNSGRVITPTPEQSASAKAYTGKSSE
jgi:hypothetical protein